MSELHRLLDRWFSFHTKLGTRVAKSWTPVPTPEHDLQKAIDALGGPEWPDDILSLYRWCNGTKYQRLFPFGTIDAVTQVRIGGDEFVPGPAGKPVEESAVHTNALNFSMEYPCVMVDRSGFAPGRIWANDVGSFFLIASSFGEYVETCVKLAEQNKILWDHPDSGVTFIDNDTRWGPLVSEQRY